MKSRVLKVIRKVLVEFIILVFVIGFFSKSISNYFLPKVRAVPVLGGVVEKSMDIVGTIEPKEKMKIRLAGNVIVEEYFVKVGQHLDVGDPVFQIDTKYGIKDIANEIESLEINLSKEVFRLEKLKGSSSLADEKRLLLLNEKLEIEKEDLTKKEKLLETGAISKHQLELKKQAIKELVTNLEIEEIKLKEKNEELYLQLKDIQNNIDKLKDEIDTMKRRQEFYSAVDDEGMYYSEVEGIVLNISEVDRILGTDTSIVEIGEIIDYSSVNFVGYVSDKYSNLVKQDSYIHVKTDDMRELLEVKIINTYNVVENGMIQIEGKFNDKDDSKPILGKKFKGKLTESNGGENIIPKIALIPDGEFKEGERGKVYLLRERKGILGKEYVAEEVSVSILQVGNDSVEVEGLSSYKKPYVITNLSHKINDGVKVFYED